MTTTNRINEKRIEYQWKDIANGRTEKKKPLIVTCELVNKYQEPLLSSYDLSGDIGSTIAMLSEIKEEILKKNNSYSDIKIDISSGFEDHDSGCTKITIVVTASRMETEKEVEERLQKHINQLEANKERELSTLKALQKKYGSIQ